MLGVNNGVTLFEFHALTSLGPNLERIRVLESIPTNTSPTIHTESRNCTTLSKLRTLKMRSGFPRTEKDRWTVWSDFLIFSDLNLVVAEHAEIFDE